MLPRNELEVNLAAARAWRMNENRKLSDLAAAGAAQIGKAEPVAAAGLFAAALEPWQAGTSYAKGAAFVHNSAVYFARQAVVSAEHQQPGSTGMEAIYGVRPIPDDDGVYPYVYNMAAVAGMRVRENGETYVCTRDIDPLLYPPSQVAAHFTKEE